MGNGSSQSIVLGPPRFQSSAYPIRSASNGYNSHHHHSSSVPKYVHPQNRVLPKPILNGQPPRLRSTDNGSILQAAGTIRGAGGHREAEAYRRGSGDYEPDHQRYNNNHRSSHHGEKENERYMNLRNHRLFHSDPNIARRPMGESPVEGYSNRRGCSNGGAAGRASKLKYKKKARAPEPPGSGNSLPRDLERTQKNNNNNCKCIAKSRAPQPPSIVVHPPPPPPPMPDSVVTTRTNIGANKPTPRSELSSSVTRAVECRDSRTSYEKNVHPLEKWRNCRSTGDVRMDEHQDDDSSRTTVFDSRKVPPQDSQTNKSYLPQQHRPDPFQKEIQMVTKKIAESRQTPPQEKSPQKPSSPPKFYFSDPSVFKAEPPIAKHKSDLPSDHRVMEDSRHKPEPSGSKPPDGFNGRRGQEHTTLDEVVPSLQRFSPGRQRFKPTSRNPTPTPKQKAEKEWEDLSKSLYHKQEDESQIDIRLRPVLPRKTPDTPKFSPSEAWQALGSDGQGSISNPSTSDDGLPSRRYSDMDFDSFKPRSLSDSHWTPRQDLSDVSSEEGDDAVSPTHHGGEVVIPARFSLPTVMFSNMRPIGTEVKSSKVPEGKGGKKNKKIVAPVNRFDDQQQPGFRRFLSRRSKYQSEEDIAVSDSNWTFGQYGLQKRGKQYSSELMLSDRKKYELMAKNDIGDFLGDILASKSSHMRDQMKSSDSGNSNFSFYSTDGQVMYKGREECSPPTKGRVHDMRRRFDANFESTKGPHRQSVVGMTKKKKAEADLGRRRDLELAKMLEDEVRKRRNKEKISIRQQLQRMKSNFRSDEDEEDDFDDEAYFTEPKSREEETQSPFFSSDVGLPQTRFGGQGPSRTVVDSARLSHWQSSPALLEDSMMQNGMQPSAKGRLSLSSLMSSPDSGAWLPNDVDHWLMKQQHPQVGGRRLSEGDGSSSPTPAPPAPKKERRKTNIYKQLMDIVRKEERHLKKTQRGGGSGDSPTSSSHRESSSETASTTSYSDSSESAPSGGVGVPANREFGFRHSLQPYSPGGKGYRPVPFDLPATHYRLPGLQEEGKHIQAEVS